MALRTAAFASCRVQTTLLSRRRCHRQVTAAYSTETSPSKRFPPPFAVYKGSGALQFKPIGPTWAVVTGGGGEPYETVDREGKMLVEFAPSKGPRQYNWEAKQNIALSPAELASVILLAEGRLQDLKIFHDPNAGTDSKGTVTKDLKITPAAEGGFFFNLNVKGTAGLSCSVTAAEMKQLAVLSQYLIPRLMGLDSLFI